MIGFLVRLGIVAFGLWLASRLVPGIHFHSTATLLVAAFLLGVVNAVVRPVFVLLTLPFTIVTLGLFLLVVNAAMLGLVAWLMPGFALAGFGPALLGSLVVSFTGWVASWTIGPRGRIEIVVVRR